MSTSKRPSEPLLALLRKVATDRGLNTAALARKASLERARLKHVLSGREPLLVDELIALAEALELDPAGLGMAAEAPPDDEAAEESEDDPAEPSPEVAGVVTALEGMSVAEEGGTSDPIGAAANPYGNHAEQILRLGLALGTDIHLVLDASLVEDSGVPPQVLAKFEDRLPIRLDAAFHVHHDLRFLPQHVRMTLSFDALYTCHFPWTSILQVTLFPLPPDDEPEPEEEEVEEEPATIRRGHLRLVE